MFIILGILFIGLSFDKLREDVTDVHIFELIEIAILIIERGLMDPLIDMSNDEL